VAQTFSDDEILNLHFCLFSLHFCFFSCPYDVVLSFIGRFKNYGHCFAYLSAGVCLSDWINYLSMFEDCPLCEILINPKFTPWLKKSL
jgi:hypothetical protein